jgi:hypothetical protein
MIGKIKKNINEGYVNICNALSSAVNFDGVYTVHHVSHHSFIGQWLMHAFSKLITF